MIDSQLRDPMKDLDEQEDPKVDTESHIEFITKDGHCKQRFCDCIP